MRLLVAGLTISITFVSVTAASPTFTKDVAPIFFSKCAGCHRPGELAPMSLIEYKTARPWAKAIRTAVLTRKMPRWFADPRFGEFSNDARLTDQEISTVRDWVDSGAPEGSPTDL